MLVEARQIPQENPRDPCAPDPRTTSPRPRSEDTAVNRPVQRLHAEIAAGSRSRRAQTRPPTPRGRPDLPVPALLRPGAREFPLSRASTGKSETKRPPETSPGAECFWQAFRSGATGSGSRFGGSRRHHRLAHRRTSRFGDPDTLQPSLTAGPVRPADRSREAGEEADNRLSARPPSPLGRWRFHVRGR
jgi:hypothetical protein